MQNHPSPSAVEATDVQIDYLDAAGRSFTALENVSFRVLRGEKFVLLGPSGCGKSTLLKAIAGFLPLKKGVLLSNGHPVGQPGPERAVVFQEFDQLFAWQTVIGNILYALKISRHITGPAATKRAKELLRLVGIESAAEKYPHELSGGMKMRVAIARALALEPEILLLDEPFAALDAITRNQMQYELNRIWQETKLTIILVTHSIEEAVFLGHRVMVMTSSPARIRQIIDTRSVKDFDSPDFVTYTDKLRDLLIQPEIAAVATGG